MGLHRNSWADEISVAAGDPAVSQAGTGADWAGPAGRPPAEQSGAVPASPPPAAMGTQDEGTSMGNTLDLRNRLPVEVIDSPLTMDEAHLGSLKAMLARYVGNYIVATFLVGTQSTVSWDGVLYDVGNDYLTIYQAARDRYVVTDLYSLKFIEFYDVQRKRLCDELLRGNGGASQGS